MFVQEPRLMEELLSFKKSVTRFFFNGKGLDVHIFPARRSFAKGVLEAVAFTSFRGTRTNRSIARAFGSLLVRHIGACNLIFLSPSPHLQPSGLPLLLRASLLQLKHLRLLEH